MALCEFCCRHWPNVDLTYLREDEWWTREYVLNKECGGRQRQIKAFCDWLGERLPVQLLHGTNVRIPVPLS